MKRLFIERISNRPKLLLILKNSGWLLFDKLNRAVLGLLIGAWVARYLGPTQYGEFTLVLTYITMFQVISNLGLDGIVVREIARHANKHEENINKKNRQILVNGEIGKILGTTFALRMVTGLLCWCISVLGMLIFSTSDDAKLTAIIGGTLIFQAADTIDLWFQSQSQSKRTVVAKMVGYMCSYGLRALLIVFEASMIWFAAATLVESIISAAALIVMYRRFPCASEWWIDIRNYGTRLLTESWPYAAGGVSIIIYMRIDQVLLNYFSTKDQLGLYTGALPFAGTWHSVAMIIFVSTLPWISNKIPGTVEYMRAQSTILKVFIFFGVFFSISVYYFSDTMILLFLGEPYKDAGTSLKILALSNIPVFFGYAYNLHIVASKKSKYAIYRTIAGSFSVTVSGILLIPKLGIIGASISTLIGYFVADIFFPILFDWAFYKSLIIGKYEKQAKWQYT